jgi:hypothetical protein
MSHIFEISEIGADSSCQLALDACLSDEPIVFDEPSECSVSYAYAYTGYCEIQQDCWQSAAVQENVTALQYYSQYSSCYDQQSGGASCSCYGNQSSLAFQLPSRLAYDGACDDAVAICEEPEDVVVTGPLECIRSAQSAGSEYCNAQIACTLAASWGDVDLTMSPGMWVTCQSGSSGTWPCTCSGGTQTVDLDVEAGQVWDACTTAADQCPDLIDIASLTGGIGAAASD